MVRLLDFQHDQVLVMLRWIGPQSSVIGDKMKRVRLLRGPSDWPEVTQQLREARQ